MNGTLVEHNESIGRAFIVYYQSLFALQAANVEGLKADFLYRMPRLDDDTKEGLEGKITQREVQKAMGNLNLGKSPGPDGLSAGWYKAFKSELAPLFADVFNDAYDQKTLPPSFGKAHTIIIPKSDQIDKLKLVSSYRPISLTNIDFKYL